MFDKLIDLIVKFITLFQCWTYIDPFEETLVIRAGKFHRWRGPGWCWLWPAGFEDVITANVRPEPIQLEVQSLHTADDFAVNINVGIEYEIVDIKVHELDFDETATTNCMVIADIVTDMVQNNKFKDIDGGLVSGLKSKINRKIKKRGARITSAWLQDMSNGAAVRYWHEGIELGMGE